MPSPPRAASAALQVATATVVIAADLARPAEVLPTVLFWLGQVQQKLAATYAALERRGSKLPEQLRLRARRYFGSQHEDADVVQHTGEGLPLWWCRQGRISRHAGHATLLLGAGGGTWQSSRNCRPGCKAPLSDEAEHHNTQPLHQLLTAAAPCFSMQHRQGQGRCSPEAAAWLLCRCGHRHRGTEGRCIPEQRCRGRVSHAHNKAHSPGTLSCLSALLLGTSDVNTHQMANLQATRAASAGRQCSCPRLQVCRGLARSQHPLARTHRTGGLPPDRCHLLAARGPPCSAPASPAGWSSLTGLCPQGCLR